ncbi:MAG: sodium:proton antiporter [Oscillospiraceae bacterium]|nr:sodium:proton antiporter [Oscillospiraceae bacterium]
MDILLLLLLVLPLLAPVFLALLTRGREGLRSVLLVLLCAVFAAAACALFPLVGRERSFEGLCWFGLHFRVTSFGALMTFVAAVMWLASALTALAYFKGHSHLQLRYDVFFLLTFCGLAGVFLAADLLTLFLFFELMSFASYVWVAHNETEKALIAARVYLAVAVFGGMVLLMGLFLLYHHFETLDLAALAAHMGHGEGARPAWLYGAGGCVLLGFGAKAGMFPLHLWLPMAHPVAPAPASALLSGILTKSGVYGVLLLGATFFFGDETWGTALLLLGTVTMLLGALLAVASRDIKRTLACSSMSQIGFILFGAACQCLLGHHNAIAVWGTVLHMLNHSAIKLLLFTAAGVIYCGTHSLDYDDIRGFGRGKPALMIPFVIGALAIGGVPLWSGYVSKTLLHEALVEYIHLGAGNMLLYKLCEVLFLFSGGLTVAYMAQLVTVVFIDKPLHEHHPYRIDTAGGVVMALSAAALFAGGLLPHDTMERAARFVEGALFADSSHMHAIHYFAPVNLKGAAISLSIGAAVYFLLLRRSAGLSYGRAVSRLGAALSARLLRAGMGLLNFLALLVRPLDALGDKTAQKLGLLAIPARFCAALGDKTVQKLRLLAIPARFCAALGDWVVAVAMKLIFYRAPRIIVPRQHEGYDAKRQEHIVEKSFSLDLLCFGIGLVAVLLYLLSNL